MIVQNAQVSMTGQSQSLTTAETKRFDYTDTIKLADATKEVQEAVKERLETQKQAPDGVLVELSSEGVEKASLLSMFEAPEDYRVRLLREVLHLFTGGSSSAQSIEKALERLRQKQVSSQLNRLPNRLPKRLMSLAGDRALSGDAKVRVDVSQMSQTLYHSESTSFAMQAQVQTADGKQIDVQIDLNMSQEFYAKVESTVMSLTKDPLVINFAASSAALSQTKFSFDIDCDGTEDQISQLMSGSGFLSVDWNDDGIINDGSELFGAKSGDGFLDLSAYDQDGNGWIDEADDIFNKLRVWTRDEDGNSQLLALGETGIGALYLGNVNTPYTLANTDGQADGYIRKTGFFLREDGTAGTMQHVDLVV